MGKSSVHPNVSSPKTTERIAVKYVMEDPHWS